MGANRLAAVGAFVIAGVLLFAIGLFMIGDRRMLFGETFPIYAEFASIAGLDVGATVRLSGLQAGEVEAIHVPLGPAAPFRVRMRIRGNLRQLVRLDSVASIQNDGLVGNKFVQIEVGTEASPVVPDEGTIRSREPFDLADILQKMSDTIDTVNDTILEVREELDTALHAISTTARTAQDLMDEVGRDARAIIATAHKVTADLQVIMAGVRDGRGTIGQLLNDDTLYERAKTVAADVERAVANVRQASEDARAAIADFRGEGGPVKGLTGDLQHTLTAARAAMVNLAENTEALKRNFLFRGFFQRRGYFDLDDVSVEQYRGGALETADRRALRIWLRGDLLFERNEEGREQLSDEGRARVDSAMSQFVRYPRTSPFVVEGYAEALTADERYLLSRRRAQIVRDYVVGKYGLDPSIVTTMPMGDEAVGSPTGQKWDGVALALFVSRSALSEGR
jgi:phospholipid/cholesterol/gamma-HCH transport system substrate-binding protein